MAMNASEARILLSALLQAYREVGYRQLRRMVGQSEVVVAHGPTGTAYRLECFVGRAGASDQRLSVSGIASEAGGRRWMQAQIAVGFEVDAEDRLYHPRPHV